MQDVPPPKEYLPTGHELHEVAFVVVVGEFVPKGQGKHEVPDERPIEPGAHCKGVWYKYMAPVAVVG